MTGDLLAVVADVQQENRELNRQIRDRLNASFDREVHQVGVDLLEQSRQEWNTVRERQRIDFANLQANLKEQVDSAFPVNDTVRIDA